MFKIWESKKGLRVFEINTISKWLSYFQIPKLFKKSNDPRNTQDKDLIFNKKENSQKYIDRLDLMSTNHEIELGLTDFSA